MLSMHFTSKSTALLQSHLTFKCDPTLHGLMDKPSEHYNTCRVEAWTIWLVEHLSSSMGIKVQPMGATTHPPTLTHETWEYEEI